MSVCGKGLRASAMGAVALLGFMSAGIAYAEVDQASVANGGRLYDKWYKVVKAEKPTEVHPLYPAANTKIASTPDATWRCKECHGWDGLGKDGAYASGKHATGIIGINGMIGGDPAAVVAILKSDGHGYGDKLSDQDMTDLANFVTAGQIDWTPYIDAATKTSKGDAAVGKQVYNTVCANCHGPDGLLPKGIEALSIVAENPWEAMNKVMNGQPAEVMPALRAIDHQVSADVVAYLVTLPKQ